MRALLILLIPFAALAQTLMPPDTPATPGSACGAEGIGFDPASKGVVKMKSPGYRVDDRGNWQQCDRPCVGDQKPREWTTNGLVCTTATARGYSGVDDPRLNRPLLHGTVGLWRQDSGRTLGMLIERCDDGTRTVTYSSCFLAPVEPPVGPPPPPIASAPAPAPQGCIGTVRRGGLTGYVYTRLPEGGSAAVRLGLRYVPVWCRDNRLTLEPPAISADQAASDAKALRP